MAITRVFGLAMTQAAPDSMQARLLLAVVPEVWVVDEVQRQPW